MSTSPATDTVIKIYGKSVLASFSGRGYWTLRCNDQVIREDIPSGESQDESFDDLQVDAAFDRAYRRMKDLLRK